MEEITPDQPKRSKKWLRIAIYILAVVGLLFIALIVTLALKKTDKPAHTFEDTNETISELMTRNYGKYSEAQRGWLYVDEEDRRTYVFTVVQQKKVDGKDGDELYLVASGKPLDDNLGATSFYGVFQLRWRDGQLYEYADARRHGGIEPLAPEGVHFEALSADVWGWVVKTKATETGDGDEVVFSRNIVLAPRNEQIAVLADFNAAFDRLGAGDCAETERHYAQWKQEQDKPKAPAAATESAPPASDAKEGEVESGAANEEEGWEPPRCTKLQWSYRTDPVTDATFTPLYITRKAGMRDGEQLPAKTWKVMFDAKSYTYLLPDELKE
jgi:hypothetical protein